MKLLSFKCGAPTNFFIPETNPPSSGSIPVATSKSSLNKYYLIIIYSLFPVYKAYFLCFFLDKYLHTDIENIYIVVLLDFFVLLHLKQAKTQLLLMCPLTSINN